MSVEHVDKDRDADENVDADQTRTVRLVSGQPTGLFTHLEEIDIDFRVSGLPHAVVKQAENFRVRELVKKIESHPHREALRNSKLAGPRRSASQRINWHRKTIPIAHPLRSSRDVRKTGKSHTTNQAEMHR